MTSNAGAEQLSRSSIGFNHQDHSTDGMEAVKKVFSPEFRNRLDAIIHFNPLGKQVITSIVDKFLIKLEAKLEPKKVSLVVDNSARKWLAQKGYDPLMGARPMERVIQEYIKKPLANEILFGKLSNGGLVRIMEKDNHLILNFEHDETDVAVTV
jgi:ATP-dependent Clp protease ATP-binding subunit ClpA